MIRTSLGRTVSAAAVALVCGFPATSAAQSLIGFATLPADTFAPAPTSSQLIDPANGRSGRFVNLQPVQGFSSVLRAAIGDYLAMCDNGFGAKPNSPDYRLRVYRISPDFKTKNGGTGRVTVRSLITLSDPNSQIDFDCRGWNVLSGHLHSRRSRDPAAAAADGRRFRHRIRPRSARRHAVVW